MSYLFHIVSIISTRDEVSYIELGIMAYDVGEFLATFGLYRLFERIK